MPNQYRKRFFNGMKWTTVQQVVTQVFGYIGLIAMTFFISPDIFGIVAIASVWLSFFLLIQDFGVREHLIKDLELLENTKREYFGVLVIGAIISFMAYILFGFLYIYIYASLENLTYILAFFSLLILIRPLIVYYEGICIREQNFKFLAINNIYSSVLSNLLGVLLAYLGYALEAVIVKFLSGHLFIVMGYFFLNIKIIPSFDAVVWKKIWLFSSNLTYTKILNYFSRNADYIILGLFFSPTIVGQYSIAYKIMLLPMKNISSQVSAVLLPMMSKLHEQHEKLSRTFMKVLLGIAFIVFPLMILLSGTSFIWVNLVFPETYSYMEEMIAILCIVGAFQSIVSPLGNLFIVSGKTDVMFKTGIVKTFVMVSGFIIGGLTQNITIFMLVYMGLYIFVDMPISFYYAFKVVNFEIKDIIKRMMNIVISSLLLWFFLKVGIWFGPELISTPILLLINLVIMGIVIYFFVFQLLHENSITMNFHYVKKIIKDFKR